MAGRLFFLAFAGVSLVVALNHRGNAASITAAAAVGVSLGAIAVLVAHLRPLRGSVPRNAISAIGILAIGVGSLLSGSYPDLMRYVGGFGVGFLLVAALAAPATLFHRPVPEQWDDKGTWRGPD